MVVAHQVLRADGILLAEGSETRVWTRRVGGPGGPMKGEPIGEELKALVIPRDRANPPAAAELIAYVRERLSHYKCPRSVDFEAELPRLPTGKLYKRILRDRYWGKKS